MKKIAYLINGLVGGLSGKNEERRDEEHIPLILRYCKKSLDDNFCKDDQKDFFIFTWQKQQKDTIQEIYRPKSLVAIDQINFSIPQGLPDNRRTFGNMSRWYGFKHVVGQLQDYIERTGETYDYVVSTRFDISWNRSVNLDMTKVTLSKYAGSIDTQTKSVKEHSKEEEINIDILLHEKDQTLPDTFFGGSVKFISELSKIYDNQTILHVHKKYYKNAFRVNAHRMLLGTIQDMGIKQPDVNYLSCYENSGLGLGDYDLLRYKQYTVQDLTKILSDN